VSRVKPRNLVQYLAEFELTLADLAREQVAMFVAARNVASYVDDLEAPLGRPSWEDNDATLTDRTTDAVLNVRAPRGEVLERLLPTDEMEVSLVRSIEDLPRIFPVQWLLEEVQPDLFYVKLAHRELLMPAWRCPPTSDEGELREQNRREPVPAPAQADSARQHAYLLLDTSSTMQDHDRRGTVARGLALAFLRKGYQQGAHLAARPFAAEVGELRSGAGREDFLAIVRTVISLPNAGQTRLQTALERAAADLRGAGPCRGADIMLITDGISRLSDNPLADERLHTFILGDLFEDKDISATIDTLRQWSRTFRRIWTNRFAEVLAPDEADCLAAGRELETWLRQAQADPKAGHAGRLRRLLENVRFLVRQFKASRGKAAPLPGPWQSLERALDEADQWLAQADRTTAGPTEVRTAVRGRGLASPRPTTNGRPMLGENGAAALWQWLRGLARCVVQWARAACRTLVRRRPRQDPHRPPTPPGWGE
jgi:hypothetical protein